MAVLATMEGAQRWHKLIDVWLCVSFGERGQVNAEPRKSSAVFWLPIAWIVCLLERERARRHC